MANAPKQSDLIDSVKSNRRAIDKLNELSDAGKLPSKPYPEVPTFEGPKFDPLTPKRGENPLAKGWK